MLNFTNRHATPLLILVATLLLQGCASTYLPRNQSITSIEVKDGYRLLAKERKPQADHVIALSFSGGGTRAAALTYGVLQELRDTQIDSMGKRTRMLDEVDTISSVSGGSFTAAYYGLFGDDIFKDYERKFLNQSVQGTLIRKMLNPIYWARSMFSAFNRTEMAIEYYDLNIFEGKTFADIPIDKRPFIEINATDLSTGARFSFTQATFDVICSDLNKFSVARAVTASSAVPIAFPSVVLKNYGGTCNSDRSKYVQQLRSKEALSADESGILDRYNMVQDATDNPYLHLVDGGISDNLGLRALMDRIVAMGGIVDRYDSYVHPPKDILLLLVNAAVAPKKSFSQSSDEPSISETIDALSSTQISLYNEDTINRVQERLKEYEAALAQAGHPVKFYFVELEFQSFTSPSIKDFFNNLPTSLELSKDQVDSLILGGRKLLRENPEYQEYLKANNGILSVTKQRERCNRLLNPLCIW